MVDCPEHHSTRTARRRASGRPNRSCPLRFCLQGDSALRRGFAAAQASKDGRAPNRGGRFLEGARCPRAKGVDEDERPMPKGGTFHPPMTASPSERSYSGGRFREFGHTAPVLALRLGFPGKQPIDENSHRRNLSIARPGLRVPVGFCAAAHNANRGHRRDADRETYCRRDWVMPVHDVWQDPLKQSKLGITEIGLQI
jgi:hypothetical protein